MYLLCLLLSGIPGLLSAATYYVGTTGNDSNDGSSGSRFLTIGKCLSVVSAGDTCIVGSGTYTDTDGNGTVAATTSGHAGASGNPITLQSETLYGAIITVPGLSNQQNTGLAIGVNYLTVRYFDITGGLSGTGSTNAHTGIEVGAATGVILENNRFHDIARTLCYNDPFGNQAVFASGSTNLKIRNNIVYSVGRLRNGESGCSTTIHQHDHGFYLAGNAGLEVTYNVIWDTNRGYPIHLYGGTSSNQVIAHNTLIGSSPTGSPAGQILFGETITTADIVNNLSYDSPYFLDPNLATASGVTVRYNIMDGVEKVTTKAGVTFSNNLQSSTTIRLTNPGSNDYTLQSNSAAVDAGTILGGSFTYNGAAPDMGAFETSPGAATGLSRSSKGMGLFR